MDLGAFPLTKINLNKKPNTKTCEPFTTKKKNNNNNIKLKKKKKKLFMYKPRYNSLLLAFVKVWVFNLRGIINIKPHQRAKR